MTIQHYTHEALEYKGKFFTVAVELSDHPRFNLLSFLVTDKYPDDETIKESLRSTKIGLKVNLGYSYIENALRHYIHEAFGQMDVMETRDINEQIKALKNNLKDKIETYESNHS